MIINPNLASLMQELSGLMDESDLIEIKNVMADNQNRIKRFTNQ